MGVKLKHANSEIQIIFYTKTEVKLKKQNIIPISGEVFWLLQ